MSTFLPVVPGSFPDGYCWPETPQEFLVDLAPRLFVSLPDTWARVYRSASAPPADKQDWIWFNLNNLKVYNFQNGGWWRAADSTPGPSGERMWWGDTEASLWSYQGGDGTDPSTSAPTAYTGSLWERDTTWDAKFPLPIGTLPSGTVVAVGDTGGEEKHALTDAENGPHTHPAPAGSDGFYTHAAPLGTGIYNVGSGSDTLSQGLTGSSGSGTPHNTMPPWKAGFWAKRTIRTWVQ